MEWVKPRDHLQEVPRSRDFRDVFCMSLKLQLMINSHGFNHESSIQQSMATAISTAATLHRLLVPSVINTANLIALIYNWWNLYVRFYDEEHHREAITSRPALMQGVARQVQSGGQRKVKVSLLHENGEMIAQAVTLISRQLHAMMRIAEQWTIQERWALLLTRLLRRWLGGKWITGVPPNANLALLG